MTLMTNDYNDCTYRSQVVASRFGPSKKVMKTAIAV